MEDEGEHGRSGEAVCEVTGRRVAADDAVEFQGRLVSAEGKEILLERLRNGEPVPGKGLVRPSFIRRLLCSLLDSIFLFFLWIMSDVLIYDTPEATSMSQDFATGAYGWYVFGAACPFVYYWLMQGAYGQTLGKMAGGFRVVNMDGSPLRWHTSLKRAFWSDGIDLIPVVVSIAAGSLSEGLILVTWLYSLVNCLALVTDGEFGRALHDRLAGTRVVMNPRRG